MRVGFGFDSHQLVKERPLILGGVNIPYEKGLAGHSDADVLLHAIIDALIGAAGLSSIGELFPDTDPGYKNVDSMLLLEQTVNIIKLKGYRVINVDSTILAEEPKLSAYCKQMREKIAAYLKLEIDEVSIKPKRGEGMGFVGRKEGIAAMAVVLIQKH